MKEDISFIDNALIYRCHENFFCIHFSIFDRKHHEENGFMISFYFLDNTFFYDKLEPGHHRELIIEPTLMDSFIKEALELKSCQNGFSYMFKKMEKRKDVSGYTKCFL